MKIKWVSCLSVGSLLAMTACGPLPAIKQAYWQRVEDNSALYMTGPKAQQKLDEDIATCVRKVDELVELDALRETMPPDTHSEYHHALDKSGDLSYYDTPTRYGDMKVAHTDFHDYESCMRSEGWERVKFVRYQTALKSKRNNTELQQYRATGKMGEAAAAHDQEIANKAKAPYATVNK
jgi:hypothetical protein